MDIPQHGNSSTTIENSVTGKTDQNQCQEKRAPRIAVLGDIMLDIDSHCKATRLCQEGPWPVLSIEREEHRLGGAGNVANMVRALGAECELLGFGSAVDYLTSAGTIGVFLQLTTKKHRLYVDGVLIGPRMDEDFIANVEDYHISQWSDQLQAWRPDAIIVADHGKGVVTAEVMLMLDGLNIPLFIDPVDQTPLPNTNCEAVIGSASEIPKLTWGLAVNVIEKRAGNGMLWFRREYREPCGSIASACRNLVDPLGAGDQFIAALVYRRCLGMGWAAAIEWANHAAGLQCERLGCVPVTVEDMRAFQSA